MANNVFAGKPNVIRSKTGVNISFTDAGITSLNTYIIYKVDNAVQSYVPGRLINPITAFESNTGYWLVPKLDFDISAFVIPDNDVVSGGVTQGELESAITEALDSPVFTGTPSAPTAAEGTDTMQLATTEFAIAAADTAASDAIAASPIYFSSAFTGTGTEGDPINVSGAAGVTIDDTAPAADKVYSSEKVEDLIGDIGPGGGLTLEEVVTRADVGPSITKRLIYASADTDNGGLKTLYFHAGTKLLMLDTTEVDVPVAGAQALDFSAVNDGDFDESPAGTWGGIANGHGVADMTIAAGEDGYIEADYGGTANLSTYIGLDIASSLNEGRNGDWQYLLYVKPADGHYMTAGPGFFPVSDSGIVATAGDKFRLKRTSGVITSWYYRAATWNLLYTFVATETGELWAKGQAAYSGGDKFLLNPKGYNIS